MHAAPDTLPSPRPSPPAVPLSPRPGRLRRAAALALAVLLAACGGGGGAPGAADGGANAATVIPLATLGNLPQAPATPASGVAGPSLPALPRSGLTAAELAVVIADGDALSEAIGQAYQRARGIPDAHVVRVSVPTGRDAITAAEFAPIKAAVDARLGPDVQASVLTFTRPSRVQGDTCTASITSAMAFGYDSRLCGQCATTLASPYFDSDTTRPYTDLRIRPSMMLGARSLAEAQALIARGLAADGSQPQGTGHAVRTDDVARSVRWPDFSSLPANWTLSPGLAWQLIDNSSGGAPGGNLLADRSDVLFYFTGLAKVDKLDTLRFLPGAAADHLTSTGGVLPDGHGQMTALAWLAAGATASYGSVEEPCNHLQKFPRASLLVDHYVRGATLIEAYWKSVAWPGQGLFVGEPLARPWASEPQVALDGSNLVLRSRALRRGGSYRVEWQRNGASPWQTLASLVAGQPRPLEWRVPLGAAAASGVNLRVTGPCPLQPGQTCTLAY